MTASETKRLLEELRAQHDLLERVATGEDSIKDVNGDYRDRRDRLVPLLAAAVQEDPFPWRDLWTYWKEEGKPLTTYAERRASLSGRIEPLERFCLTEGGREGSSGLDGWFPHEQPTNWRKTLDRMESMKEKFKSAVDLDDFQDVGRRCREIILDATDLVHDPGMAPEGEEPPKKADAGKRMDHICAALLSGPTHEHLRAVLKKTLRLAQHVTHGNVTRLEALAAAQGTIMLVSTLQELERLAVSDPEDEDEPIDPEDLTDLAADYWQPPEWEDDSPEVQVYDQSGG